jgi:hypothetical protein
MFERFSRAFFVLLGLAALAAFAALSSVSYVTWQQTYGSESLVLQALGALEMFLLFPGVAPLLVALYFFVVVRDIAANCYGFVVVALFVFTHYITSGISMHAVMYIFMPLQLLELAIALAVIYFHYQRMKRISSRVATDGTTT